MRTIKQAILLFSISLASVALFAQTFEGSITYKMEALNPNAEFISDSLWQASMKAQFGARGYILQKYYYKKDKYISEIQTGNETGFQAFNTIDKLLYSWQMNSDSAVTVDSRTFMDEFIDITLTDLTDTILGIPCKSAVVKSNMGQMTLWYNSNYFKMDARYYQGHVYGHWEHILKAIGCLPLKMDQQGFMMHIVQTAIEYSDTAVDDKKFFIPKFKVITENPFN